MHFAEVKIFINGCKINKLVNGINLVSRWFHVIKNTEQVTSFYFNNQWKKGKNF